MTTRKSLIWATTALVGSLAFAGAAILSACASSGRSFIESL